MKKKFTYKLNELCPNYITAKFLLAVSGGVDSMVMMKMFQKCGLDFSVAHCNFHLRDTESDRDEQFVKEEVEKIGKKLHLINFETTKYSKERNISIEEAARELRYKWFSELANKYGYDYIVVAHNKNDLVETMFINLNRSTGINGLASIPEKNGKIIRPLLEFSRKDIKTFANKEDVRNIEDSSNATDLFLRNKIRHNLIPVAETIMPGFVNRAAETTKHLKIYKQIIDNTLNNKIEEYGLSDNKRHIEIDIDKIKDDDYFELIILYILQKYEFPSKILSQITKCTYSKEAKKFCTKKWKIIVHREKLIVRENINEKKQIFLLNKDLHTSDIPFLKKCEKTHIENISEISKKCEFTQLDYNKLKFPLEIRHWKSGDKIKPFGMKGYKTISKYLSDKKIFVEERENTYIISSNDEIVAIIGHCVSDKFAIKNTPCEILKIEIQ